MVDTGAKCPHMNMMYLHTQKNPNLKHSRTEYEHDISTDTQMPICESPTVQRGDVSCGVAINQCR